MNRLMGDLVDVASIRAGTLAVTRRQQTPDLVVHEAVEMFQAQAGARGVTLVTTLVPPPTAAAFDPARILQVLTAETEAELITLKALEVRYLQRVLSLVGGNKSRAAEILGVDRRTLYRMLERNTDR